MGEQEKQKKKHIVFSVTAQCDQNKKYKFYWQLSERQVHDCVYSGES